MSFSKNIFTPWQPMRCSLGSVLRFSRCLDKIHVPQLIVLLLCLNDVQLVYFVTSFSGNILAQLKCPYQTIPVKEPQHIKFLNIPFCYKIYNYNKLVYPLINIVCSADICWLVDFTSWELLKKDKYTPWKWKEKNVGRRWRILEGPLEDI